MNLNKIIKIAVISYVLVNLMAALFNLLYFGKTQDVTDNETILVVAAHQDDETIIAGGAIIKTITKGGKVYVIYTVDGVTRSQHLSENDIRMLIEQRKLESLLALNSVGVPLENIYFLKYENTNGLQDINNVKQAINQITEKIININPNKIFIAAFEGGNCDHDITNYIAGKAAAKANLGKDKIFEAPEYNSYYLTESILKRVNKLMLIKFSTPPRFLPDDKKTIILPMSEDELNLKRSMLRFFESQNVEDELVWRFGYRDRYRLLEEYDYVKGPFNPETTLRYKICLVLKKDEQKCNPFYLCSMKLQDYNNLYSALEKGNAI